jgi:hypothetical protein
MVQHQVDQFGCGQVLHVLDAFFQEPRLHPDGDPVELAQRKRSSVPMGRARITPARP